jgi:hypothetical protein
MRETLATQPLAQESYFLQKKLNKESRAQKPYKRIYSRSNTFGFLLHSVQQVRMILFSTFFEAL